jgi:DNA-directed RNA polymerase alpha subunit/DNA-directed RNA polymerase subunit L
MNPHVEIKSKTTDDILSFTLSNINVSFANAIRRIILSEIPIVVFKTTPHEQNKCNIITNTTRFHNEIIKQRLSCIPIHIDNFEYGVTPYTPTNQENKFEEFPYQKYIMELNVENKTDTIIYATTEDFIIKDIESGKQLSDEVVKKIFPSNSLTGFYIDFIRLKPKISDEIPGEKIHLTCEFSVGNAKEDACFNVQSTCSYGYTIDVEKQKEELEKLKQTWKNNDKTAAEIEFEEKNWKLLEGLRMTKANSFDFILETLGIYTNAELITKSCDILVSKLDYLEDQMNKDELKIENSLNTMTNCFDIILENEDYTIGKILEYCFYTKFYETKILTFCGFNKVHPHDSESIIRVAYKDAVEKVTIKGHVKECIDDCKTVFEKIKKSFIMG